MKGDISRESKQGESYRGNVEIDMAKLDLKFRRPDSSTHAPIATFHWKNHSFGAKPIGKDFLVFLLKSLLCILLVFAANRNSYGPWLLLRCN